MTHHHIHSRKRLQKIVKTASSLWKYFNGEGIFVKVPMKVDNVTTLCKSLLLQVWKNPHVERRGGETGESECVLYCVMCMSFHFPKQVWVCVGIDSNKPVLVCLSLGWIWANCQRKRRWRRLKVVKPSPLPRSLHPLPPLHKYQQLHHHDLSIIIIIITMIRVSITSTIIIIFTNMVKPRSSPTLPTSPPSPRGR